MKERPDSSGWWRNAAESSDLRKFFATATRQQIKKHLEPVLGHRAEPQNVQAVCSRFGEDIFEASAVNGRALNAADRILVDNLPPSWQLIELSPIEPLGSNTKLTGLSQFPIAYAARDSEVVPDAVIPLCVLATQAVQHRGHCETLAASHRELRMQPHAIAGYSKHFRAFSVVTVEREAAHHAGKRAAIRRQVLYWYTTMLALAPSRQIRIELSYTPIARALVALAGWSQLDIISHTRVGQPNPLPLRFPGLVGRLDGNPDDLLHDVGLDAHACIPAWYRQEAAAIMRLCPRSENRWDLSRLGGHEYYDGACYRVSVRNGESWVSVVDGGFSNWAQQISKDRSLICLTGGLGTEHLLRVLQGDL
jgi:hypothetical protein